LKFFFLIALEILASKAHLQTSKKIGICFLTNANQYDPISKNYADLQTSKKIILQLYVFSNFFQFPKWVKMTFFFFEIFWGNCITLSLKNGYNQYFFLKFDFACF
jgi:hypothetical protein